MTEMWKHDWFQFKFAKRIDALMFRVQRNTMSLCSVLQNCANDTLKSQRRTHTHIPPVTV